VLIVSSDYIHYQTKTPVIIWLGFTPASMHGITPDAILQT